MPLSKLESIIALGTTPLSPHFSGTEIRCADGFRVSIVAGGLAYSTPRSESGPYSAVEVGYPNRVPTPFAEWDAYEIIDTVDEPQERKIYGWVPVNMVRALIASHGGEA